MSERGNLRKTYEPLTLSGWEGCAHLDCLPQCDWHGGHCERLRLHLAAIGEESSDDAVKR